MAGTDCGIGSSMPGMCGAWQPPLRRLWTIRASLSGDTNWSAMALRGVFDSASLACRAAMERLPIAASSSG